MSRFIRWALLVVATLLVSVTSSGAASATLSVNPVTTTATATGTTSLIDSTGTTTQFTCASASIVMAIRSDGTGTVATGDARFSTCTLGVTVTQLGPWTVEVINLLSGGRITGQRIVIRIPADNTRVKAALGADYYQGGTMSYLIVLNPPVTPPALTTKSRVAASDWETTLGITVTRVVSNSLIPAIALGDQLRMAVPLSFSPSVTSTLI